MSGSISTKRGILSDAITVLLAFAAMAMGFLAWQNRLSVPARPLRLAVVLDWAELVRVATWPPQRVETDSGAMRVLVFIEPGCTKCLDGVQTVESIAMRRGKVVRIGYLHYPRPTAFPGALSAAIAAECAQRAGRFLEYVGAMVSALDSAQLAHTSRVLLSDCDRDSTARRIVERHILAGRQLGLRAGGAILLGGFLIRPPVSPAGVDSAWSAYEALRSR